MYINGITSASNESVNATSYEKDLGKEAFLRLLVAQLEHQDPLNPMESADFTAQLAQFSSLEQLVNINDNLEAIKATNDEDVSENLLDYIGKEIRSDQNSIAVYDGKSSGATYSLSEPGDVIISVFDSDGTPIRTIYQRDQEAGEHDFYFDGKDNYGEVVPDGDYSFTVQAVDAAGSAIAVDSGLSGLVTAVTYQGGVPYLVVGDQLISPQYITEVRLGPTS